MPLLYTTIDAVPATPYTISRPIPLQEEPMSQQAQLFAQAVQHILEAVMFENWLRFYFITEKPGDEEKEKLFIAVPEQGMRRISELHTQLLPLAESLNGKEIDFETSRSAICTYVVTEVDGKRIPRNMADMVFASDTFQMETQLFNTWVQAHETQLDQGFLDFSAWKKMFAEWRQSDAVKDWAVSFAAVAARNAPPDENTVH